jgi:hypothetical protein
MSKTNQVETIEPHNTSDQAQKPTPLSSLLFRSPDHPISLIQSAPICGILRLTLLFLLTSGLSQYSQFGLVFGFDFAKKIFLRVSVPPW